MSAQDMLELIERQEKLLRDALAQLGDAKRHLRAMLTATTTTCAVYESVAVDHAANVIYNNDNLTARVS